MRSSRFILLAAGATQLTGAASALQFGPQSEVASVGTPLALELHDIDDDGDAALDVVCGARNQIYGNFGVGTFGTTYCASNPNSTGVAAELTATGTTNLNFDELALTVTDLPPASFGFFITSRTQGMVNMPAGSQGVLCVVGQVGRYVAPGEPQFSGIQQRFRLRIAAGERPLPNGFVTVQAGQTWNFQAWYRDAINGQPTSNFSSAVAVTF